ncbi:DUF4097 domain-containing protein [Microbacterium flavum]|uniref:Adhesin domain-containing protein n=1 Tax=Microbacterium flavum TaxID=415216 RepID=A0ABS5XQ18_9MICO|nr:DUF4097 domain-containing protein [Microbacterium flavum]MBT8796622.1 hypothetical protein [Microbacterium flavum]
MTLTTPSRPRSSARVIAVLAIAFGALLIVGTLVLGAVSSARAAAVRTDVLTTDAAGIRDLDVDVAAADLTIVYRGDGVSLQVTGAASDWTLRRDGERLVVSTDRTWWGGWSLFGREADVATLTLPASLERTALDADLAMSGGMLRAEGTYGELSLDLSAGAMDVSGSATDLDADVSAGRLSFDLSGARGADLKLSAGSVTGNLSGSAPRAVSIDASAGRLDLTLPSGAYAVASDVSAGEFRNDLTVDPDSPDRVEVSVSAGFVRLGS